jgi:hypothetical protein
VWKLRVVCADAWPGLIRECERAMSAVWPGNKVSAAQKVGCAEVMSCSRHWPCLFPRHGPGKKHMRKIELQPWQRTIVLLICAGLVPESATAGAEPQTDVAEG